MASTSGEERIPLKKRKRDCRYQQEWKQCGIIRSKRGPTFARCDTCNCDFSIAHGGASDMKRHLVTVKHKEMSNAIKSNQSLTVLAHKSATEEAVTKAEVLFSMFIAEHNLPFLVADHFTHLTSAMFPDSKIAKAFSAAKTKTTCIIKGALFPHFTEPVIELCRKSSFSILCDEGNDNDDKNFAILVRLWDENLGKPITRFLDMPVCNIATGEKLFELIDKSLFERQIPWSNVVGFESDTANVMIGRHNSVLSRVKTKQPNVFSQGCTCHLANLCLLKGVQALPVDVDDFFVDLFYHFDKSTKRKEELHEFQEFTGTKQLKIIKHCKTRWLSLEKVVQRTLQQWPALNAYFDKLSEHDHSARVLRIQRHFRSHLTKLVLFFLEFSLDSMCKFNSAFQLTLPMLPFLKSEVNRLLRILLSRFMKPEILAEAQNNFSSIDFDDSSAVLPDESVSIGHKTWLYLTENDDDLDERTKKRFFEGVKCFYTAVVTTMLTKFSFKDELVDDVVILLPENQPKVNVSTVSRLIKRFNKVVPEDEYDALESEVLDYSLTPMAELPSVPREEGKLTKSAEICEYWQKVGMLKTLEGTDRFPHLVRLAKCILALPHSNADTERVFSITRKILTDYRSELDQSTLCALVACKMNSDEKCFELNTPKNVLDVAKGATMKYNREHISRET